MCVTGETEGMPVGSDDSRDGNVGGSGEGLGNCDGGGGVDAVGNGDGVGNGADGGARKRSACTGFDARDWEAAAVAILALEELGPACPRSPRTSSIAGVTAGASGASEPVGPGRADVEGVAGAA